MAKPIQINRHDYTSYFPGEGYSVSYIYVNGNSAGLMLDGTYTADELAIKAVVTLNCMPLNETQLRTILTDVLFYPYVDVYYFDPRTAAFRRISALREIIEQKYRGYGTDENEYWTGTVLKFTER